MPWLVMGALLGLALLSALLTWAARGYALRQQLMDQPGERRSHSVATPRGGGIAIVISDFYDPDGYEEGLNLLRYHRFEPTVLQVYSQKEADPQLRGDVEIVDMETGETREVTVTERQLADYKQLHRQWCDGLRDFCGSRGVAYFRADTGVPFDELVLKIFRAGGFLS